MIYISDFLIHYSLMKLYNILHSNKLIESLAQSSSWQDLSSANSHVYTHHLIATTRINGACELERGDSEMKRENSRRREKMSCATALATLVISFIHRFYLLQDTCS